MSKNLWIILVSTVIILITLALVVMLILLPESSTYATGIAYDRIEQKDYTYVSNKYDPKKEETWELYEIDESDILNSKKEQIYRPGNESPFTPEGDRVINIYQEEEWYEEGFTGNGNSSNIIK